MSTCCRGQGGSKSILQGIELKLPKNLSVTDYFRQCIIDNSIKGDSPAVVASDGHSVSYTFSDLDSLSTKLAKALRKYLGFWTCNNPDGDLVMAFALTISENIPIVLLAILKLGATFLAIPTIYPEQLIVKIVSLTRPMIIITESSGPTQARYDCVSGLVPLVEFDEIWDMALHGGFDSLNEVFPLETLVLPAQRIASIVYTAGTMDQQLAVRIGHREIFNRCLWQYKEFPYVEGEVQSLSSGLEDVDSIAEIFAPLLAGVPIHLIPRRIFSKPEALLTRIQEAKISRITLAPPAFATLLAAYENMEEDAKSQEEPLSTVKYWTVSGDAMPQELVNQFFNLLAQTVCNLPHPQSDHNRHHEFKSKEDVQPVTLIHLYGSTEVMSDVTFETFELYSNLEGKFREDKVSIGRPIANTLVYIVDEDMRIVENGELGEIFIAGACISSGGYVSGTEKDDTERFFTNPFTKKKGFTTIYQTEDFGRIVENKEGIQNLFYEGRTEMTATVDGKRVDLRDISKLVYDTKLVEKCSVLCFHPGKMDQAIVAFCILKPDVTPQELTEVVQLSVMTDGLIMPQIYSIEQFHYLPSGRLDKHKLLKQYLYFIMNASQEEWLTVPLSTPHQKSAAKALFSAIAKYTGRTVKQVIDGHTGSLWSLGVTSLNALAILLQLRETGYIVNIDIFLRADSLLAIVEGMKTKTKGEHLTSNIQKFKLFGMPHENFYADVLKSNDKGCVIRLLCESYISKNELCRHLSITHDVFEKLVECQWKQIMKDNLSLVAYAHADDGAVPVGAMIILDASENLKIPSNCPLSLKYLVELVQTTDKAPKEHIVWKKKGSVSQILMVGTSNSLNAQENIMVVALLFEAAKIGAKSKGYDGTLISGQNALISDLCEGILNYKLLEEVQIYKFRAKDKSLPFRLISEYKMMQVLYDNF